MNGKPLLFTASILLLAVFALSATVLYPALSESQRKGPKKPVPTRGSIKSVNIGVYSDQACTTSISSIDWGILDPSSTTNKTIYTRNEGPTPANMSLTVTNWNPSNASNYINLNWDYTGQTLAVNEAIQVTFTLSILENIQGQGIANFSFDTIIATV